MRKVALISAMAALMVILSHNSVLGQPAPDQSNRVEAVIDFKGHEINGGYIIINYALPFAGMVEFRLYDHEGKKIWQNQYAQNLGDNRIVLRASKLKPGETYAYQMVYKRDMIMKNFEIPSGGTE